MAKFTLTINGQPHTVEAAPMSRLLDVLRHSLALTGTKEGCGEGECGACSVILDGVLVNSCLVPVAQADGTRICTIEGVAHGDELHPVQAAFIAHDGLQCGFCTPGQIMSAIGLLEEGHAGDDPERIREGMSGNLCRCGAYAGITEAVLDAQKNLGASKPGSSPAKPDRERAA